MYRFELIGNLFGKFIILFAIDFYRLAERFKDEFEQFDPIAVIHVRISKSCRWASALETKILRQQKMLLASKKNWSKVTNDSGRNL